MSIAELEQLRIKARNTILIGIVCSVILTLLIFLYSGSFLVLFIGMMIGIVVTSFVALKPTREFTLAYKETFVLELLKSVFTDLHYDPYRGIEESVIRNTQMMNMGDRYSSNDYICAKYKNINVEQADVHIEEEHVSTDSDGHSSSSWVTIFKGRWMVFDFNKNFKANVQVSQKGFGNAKINNWGNKIKYKKVAMEDEMFNKQFRIYAQSEHEAFYILTPSLMERIKRLTNSIDGKILFCFIDKKLHVGLQNNEDSFEHSIFKKIDENKVIEEISKDINLITNFVDELNLDNDLFRKEV